MKTFLAICLAAVAAFAFAAEQPAAAPSSYDDVVKGEVLEVIDVNSYTYLRLKTRDGEVWGAVAKTQIKVGTEVTIENAMMMKDFKSPVLQRIFPILVLGSLAGTQGESPHGGENMAANPHGERAATPHGGAAGGGANVKVSKATGANAKTVAEVVTNSAELKDKPVLVRGQVVKYNGSIMGMNWAHLRDGTGSDADGSSDVLVTTRNTAKLGDIVTANGTVRTDKDFGSGYSYKVFIEDATLQQ